MANKNKAKAAAVVVNNDDDETETTAVTVSAISAQSMNAEAVNMAAKVITGNVASELTGLAVKAEDVKKAAVHVMAALMASAEKDGWDLESLPEPGVETPGANRPVEVWKEQVPKDGGGVKTVTYRFFHIMFDNSEAGKKLAADIAALETDGNLTASQREAEGRKYKQRRNNMIAYLRRGVGLYYRLNRWAEKFPALDIQPVDANTPYPIHVYDASDPKKNAALSVGEFFKINETKLETEGGDYQAFLNARARARAPKAPDGKGNIKIAKWQDAEAAMAALVNFLDDVDLRASMIAAARKADNESLVHNISTLNAFMIGAAADVEDLTRAIAARKQKAAIAAAQKAKAS